MAEYTESQVEALRQDIAALKAEQKELQEKLKKLQKQIAASLTVAKTKLEETSTAWVDGGNQELQRLSRVEADLLTEFSEALNQVNEAIRVAEITLVRESAALGVEEEA